MSDIDDVIDTLDLRGHGNIVGGMILRARAELAQLRADLQAAQERIAQLTTERDAAQIESDKIFEDASDKISKQARQLEQAREIIGNTFITDDPEVNRKMIKWIHENAPQEQEA